MRKAWMAGLLWTLGCGGAVQPAESTASNSSDLSALRAQLGTGAAHLPEIAAGDNTIDVPPSVFGTTTDVVGQFLFVAVRDPSGGIHGLYRVSEAADGSTFHYSGRITCVGIYDFNGRTGNRAKVGGQIDATDDPTVAVGSFIWWQAIDNQGLDRPDQSTFAGFGDEAANEAFCGASTPPRFGPFDLVRGNIFVGPGDDG